MKTLRRKMRQKKCKNKKRQKTRKNKVNKGGKINHSVASTRVHSINVEIPNSEINFAKSKLTDGLEYCGKYVTDNVSNATYILRRHDDNPGAVDIKGRPYCELREKDLYGIIWHTHPNTSKFYPSTEDILMVKKLRKGEKIKLSVIYTTIGIWLLEGLGDDLNEKEISRINDKLYHNCFRGRTTTPGYNFQHVLDYIKLTYEDEMLNYCEMNVIFEPYTIDQTINAILTDVRLDALTP